MYITISHGKVVGYGYCVELYSTLFNYVTLHSTVCNYAVLHTVSQIFPQPQFACLEVLLMNSFICDHGGLFCEILKKIHLGFRGVRVIKNP